MTVFQNLSPFFPSTSFHSDRHSTGQWCSRHNRKWRYHVSSPLCLSFHSSTLLLFQACHCSISSERGVFSYILELSTLTMCYILYLSVSEPSWALEIDLATNMSRLMCTDYFFSPFSNIPTVSPSHFHFHHFNHIKKLLSPNRNKKDSLFVSVECNPRSLLSKSNTSECKADVRHSTNAYIVTGKMGVDTNRCKVIPGRAK